ncbi:MAG: radical SAM protein [Candidatus Eisenbacteria bacterium]|uniref:Radical SAM protein n=1 Tax=Eiseniibacteriota bacterium TaxID=2212470 RepID=A0A956LWX1_UNCEI|nr:radical SAM protein [Candidatus Eisenbacteria bacterium]
MRLRGLHLLTTYRCTYQCDHCFVWGSPSQTGTMRWADIENILDQARQVPSIEWIYFEGGEPFLYYATLLRAIEEASAHFRVGLVTNAYWATSVEDAREWLRPMAGRIEDLSVSRDGYHGDDANPRHAMAAADALGIPVGSIAIAPPELRSETSRGKLPNDMSGVCFRGRAAEVLTSRAPQSPWESFGECPYENLRAPSRVHVDPLGFVHVCQGISMGNLFQTPLRELCDSYDPETHPIVGPLLRGGSAELARTNGLSPQAAYADACHLCYRTRVALRDRFPKDLAPDQAYGVVSR